MARKRDDVGVAVPAVVGPLIRQSVVATLTDGSGVMGVVWEHEPGPEGFLLLVPAAGQLVSMLDAEGTQKEIAGNMFIPGHALLFVQLPGGA